MYTKKKEYLMKRLLFVFCAVGLSIGSGAAKLNGDDVSFALI